MTELVPRMMLFLFAKESTKRKQDMAPGSLSAASLHSPHREKRAENLHGQSQFFPAILNVGGHSKRLEHSPGCSEYPEAS